MNTETPLADVWIDDGKIFVQPYPAEMYSVQPILKLIPGIRFLPAQKLWYATATANVAQRLRESFPARYHESFNPFLQEYEKIQQVQAVKTATDLDPLPSNTSPWLHQTQAAHFLRDLSAGGLFADMGCIGGDASVTLKLSWMEKGGKSVSLTLEQLYALAFEEEDTDAHKRGKRQLALNRCGYKPDMFVGARIRTFDLKSRKPVYARITNMVRKSPSKVLRVKVTGRDPFFATPDHKFWVRMYKEWEWLPISECRAGCWVMLYNSQFHKYYEESIDYIEEEPEPITVYDISCEAPLNHFAVNDCIVANCGKSKVVVDLQAARQPKRMLIVCPKRVMGVWPRQFAQHSIAPPKVTVLDGSLTERINVLNATKKNHGVWVTNYDAFQYERFSDVIYNANFDAVILDESHKIKAAGGKTSQFFAKLGRKTKWRMCLTGTPNADKPLDIYAQYRFLDPGIFGTSYDRFKRKYAIFGGYGGYEIIGYLDLDELHEKMYSIAFRVTDEVLDLPSYQSIDVPISLSAEAQAIYRKMMKEMVAQIGNGVLTVDNCLAKLTRLAQISSGYLPMDQLDPETGEPTGEIKLERFDESKQETLAELIDDIPENEPLVVFARFRPDIDAVKAVVAKAGRKAYELSGRKDEWETWQYKATGNEVLIVQVAAGGAGVELFRSRYAIYYSWDYSLTNFDQSRKRIHRPGQTRPVINYYLTAGLDSKILAALQEKKDIAAYVTDLIGQDPSTWEGSL